MEGVSFWGIIFLILLCAGFYFLMRWIVRKMFEFRDRMDEIEEPGGFWDKVFIGFFKFIFRTADRLAGWMERKSSFFAQPYDKSNPVISIVSFVIWLLGIFFLILANKHQEQIIWTILSYLFLMPGIFEFLLPKQKDDTGSRLTYELSWGGFVAYLLLFEIVTIVILFVLLLLVGSAIASNAESTPSGGTREERAVSEVPATKTDNQQASSSPQEEKPAKPTTSSSNQSKSNSQSQNKTASNSRKAPAGQVITVTCPKCGKSVAVNCRGTNGQSSDTAHCRNCGRLVYVLYENSSFGFRVIRVW